MSHPVLPDAPSGPEPRPDSDRRRLCAGLLALGAGAWAAPAAAATQPSLHARWYQTTPMDWDLSALPAYKPAHKLQGVLRFHGSETATNLLTLWEEGFRKGFHHDIRFRNNFLSSPVTFSGLCAGTADLGQVGHKAWPMDIRGFREVKGYDPLELVVATGTYDVRGSTPDPVFFVNRNNPISRMTLEQLDGIFGAERSGGWRDGRWDTSVARGPEKNLRTWGQLGLTGEWADKPIRLYGLDATLSQWSLLIEELVFQGGDKWNPAMKEIVRGGVEVVADDKIVEAVAADPYAMGFVIMRAVQVNPGVKPLALAGRGKDAPFVVPSRQSFQDQSYPLPNANYVYVDRAPGTALAPRLKEFLRYILSREGQECVADDGQYMPLTEKLSREQLAKLD